MKMNLISAVLGLSSLFVDVSVAFEFRVFLIPSISAQINFFNIFTAVANAELQKCI